MNPYRVPDRIFGPAPRASWWRRNIVAWARGTRRRLLERQAVREGRAILVNPRFGTHSAGPA